MILVVGDNEYDDLQITTAGEHLVRDDTVSILRWPLEPATLERSTTLDRLDGQGLLELNAVLLQSPYDPERYLTAIDATTSIAHTKLLTTVELCRRLGACSVTVEEIRISTVKGSARWRGDLSADVAGGRADSTRMQLETFVQRTRLADESPGGPPDIDGASELLRNARLTADDDLVALIGARTGSNPIASRHFHLTTSSEASNVRRRLAQVRLLPLGIGAAVDQAEERSAVYDFDFAVAFP
jgi:hypothetical protein